MEALVKYVSTAAESSTPLQLILHNLTRRNAYRGLGLYLVYLIFKYRSNAIGTRRRPELKGPRGLPLIGNLVEVVQTPVDQVAAMHDDYYIRYGEAWAFTVPFLGTAHHNNSPECLEHVLKTNFWAYEKGDLLKTCLTDLLGDGIFNSDGHQWNWQRKLASHIFNVKAFRSYTSNVFVMESQKVVDYLGKVADQGTVVDMHDLLLKFTLDSFGEVSYTQSFGCLVDPTKEVSFAVAFDRLNAVISDRLFSPHWKIREWLNGTARQVVKDKKTITDFSLDIIRRRRAEGWNQPHKDLLQLFMDVKDENNQPLTDEMLKDTILNFIIAGRDTTAQGLSWCFYLLHRTNPTNGEMRQKIVDEIESVLGATNDPTFETYKEMKYTESCFHEALRLYPSVPRNLKVCVQDDVLPNGIKVYKGEHYGWSAWTMGRSEKLWGPDAKQFNPDRWNGTKPSSAKYNSFHLGPRTCLGKNFAEIEAVTLMSMLFRKFEFELVDPVNEPAYGAGLTLPLKHGLPMRVKRRGVSVNTAREE